MPDHSRRVAARVGSEAELDGHRASGLRPQPKSQEHLALTDLYLLFGAEEIRAALAKLADRLEVGVVAHLDRRRERLVRPLCNGAEGVRPGTTSSGSSARTVGGGGMLAEATISAGSAAGVVEGSAAPAAVVRLVASSSDPRQRPRTIPKPDSRPAAQNAPPDGMAGFETMDSVLASHVLPPPLQVSF